MQKCMQDLCYWIQPVSSWVHTHTHTHLNAAMDSFGVQNPQKIFLEHVLSQAKLCSEQKQDEHLPLELGPNQGER